MVKKSPARFSRKFYDLGKTLKEGQSLASLGAESGPFAVAFEGLNRIADGMMQQSHDEQTKIVLAEADKAGASEAERAHLESRMVNLRQDDTLAAQAFNKSVQTSYLTRLDLTFEAKTNDIVARHPDDPDAFGNAFDNASGALLKNLPEEWRDTASLEIQGRRNKLMKGVSSTALKKELSEANADLVTAMNTYGGKTSQYWRDGDDVGAFEQGQKYLGALDARTDLSPQQKEAGRLAFEAEGRRHASVGEFDRSLAGGLKSGEQFIKDFRQDKAISDPDEREKIADEMEGRLGDALAKVKAAVATRNAEVKKARADRFATIDKGIFDGGYGLGDLEAEKQSGLFADAPEKHTKFHKAIVTRDKEVAERQERLALVREAMGGTRVLDPGDKKHKKAVNESFKVWAGSPDVVVLPSFERNVLSADMAKKTGIVPEAMKSQLRTGLLGNPEDQVIAADLFTRLEGEGFDATKGLGEREGAKARLLADMTAAGLAPENAVERVDKLTDPANKILMDSRIATFAGITPITPEDVADNFDIWLASEPDVSALDAPALVSEVNTLFERQYRLTGNEKLARSYAMRTIGRTWGVTEADGSKRLMKYPPEAFYRYGDDQAWISHQLVNEVQSSGMWDGSIEDRLVLVSDDTTARQAATDKPTWQVLVMGKDGVFAPVIGDDGRLLRWAPDRKKVSDETIAKLRAERAADETGIVY